MTNRRSNVPFDPQHFEKLAREGVGFSTAETFRQIRASNHWRSDVSVSGLGSDLVQTAAIRAALPPLLAELQVTTMLDLPCGDGGWISTLALPVREYTGADIVPELVEANSRTYGNEQRRFALLDLTRDELPRADLLLCRDCLVHLSGDDIWRALHNVKRSGIRYLLTTTFTAQESYEEITTGDWRALNLERAPFHFPAPLALINEGCTEGDGQFADKSLGLWSVAQLPSDESGQQPP